MVNELQKGYTLPKTNSSQYLGTILEIDGPLARHLNNTRLIITALFREAVQLQLTVGAAGGHVVKRATHVVGPVYARRRPRVMPLYQKKRKKEKM